MVLVKTIGQTTPSHITGQDFLFLRRGKAVLRFQPFQQTDGLPVVIKPLTRRTNAQSVIRDTEVVPLIGWNFGMEDKRGRRFLSLRYEWRRRLRLMERQL